MESRFQRRISGRLWAPPLQRTNHNGERSSTASAYLYPARSRSNLTVLNHAFATKLLINGRCATGVHYLHNGIIEQAYAGAEIIIAAGALHSPQLLMSSGVGNNLQDHIHARVRCELRQPLTFATLPGSDKTLAQQQL
jgi:choline dehydrogenase